MPEKRVDCFLGLDYPLRTLEEVQHFLDTWCFTISEDKGFFARPLKKHVTLMDIRAFLKRLDMICGDGFPRLITIDFTAQHFTPESWRACKSLFLVFARRIQTPSAGEPHGDLAPMVMLIRPSMLMGTHIASTVRGKVDLSSHASGPRVALVEAIDRRP